MNEVRLSERHVRGYFAHVQFEDTECVDRAMKKAGEEFYGHRIQLDFAYMDKVVTNNRNVEATNSRRYKPKSQKPQNGHTLWVGDVSIDASEQDLIDLFEPCGKIEMICLQVNQLRNGQFGHMKFIDTEAVDKAVELAGTAVKGVPIRLDYAEDKPVAAYRVGKDRGVPDTQKPEGCRTIWVGGLPSDATEDMVRGVFDRCGDISEIRLDRSKRGGALFCHVEFVDTSAVDRAVRLSGERLNSSKMRVDFAENRSHGGGDRRHDPPQHMPPPGMHGMPPMGPPGAWMGPPPMGFPPPGFPHGPPGHFMPPRPSGAPGTEGPDGHMLALPPGGPPRPPPPGWVPPGYPGGPPPPGYGPPPGDWRPPGPEGYPPMRPPDFFGPPPPGWGHWGPGGPPPPGYPGPPPGYPGYDPHRPPGPEGYPGGPPAPGGPPPPGYPGPPPGPSAAPTEAPGGADPAGKPRNRSRSGSVYSSYSYSSYSVSPAREAPPAPG